MILTLEELSHFNFRLIPSTVPSAKIQVYVLSTLGWRAPGGINNLAGRWTWAGGTVGPRVWHARGVKKRPVYKNVVENKKKRSRKKKPGREKKNPVEKKKKRSRKKNLVEFTKTRSRKKKTPVEKKRKKKFSTTFYSRPHFFILDHIFVNSAAFFYSRPGFFILDHIFVNSAAFFFSRPGFFNSGRKNVVENKKNRSRIKKKAAEFTKMWSRIKKPGRE